MMAHPHQASTSLQVVSRAYLQVTQQAPDRCPDKSRQASAAQRQLADCRQGLVAGARSGHRTMFRHQQPGASLQL